MCLECKDRDNERRAKNALDKAARGICNREGCEEPRAEGKKICAKHRAYYKQQEARRIIQAKIETFGAYGGCFCNCCGETRLEFLSIDHLNGGGCQHRRETGIGGGRQFYDWLKRHGYPEGFRVLCMNCQFGCRFGNTCPHKLEKEAQQYAPFTFIA